MYKVSPQLVILAGPDQRIERVLYLTLYDAIDETAPLFYFVKNFLKAENVEVHRRHVLLTLKISQLKGYVRDLLGLEEIIIYSHKNNLEYSYVDNTIFNPFTLTQKKTLIKLDSFLYNVYLDACDFLVIWAARAADTAFAELGSYDEVDKNILKFEERLIGTFDQLNLNFSITSRFNNIFKTNIHATGLKRFIANNVDRRMLLLRSDEYFIKLSGNNFVLNNERLNLSIWDDNDQLLIVSDGESIVINDVELFTEISDEDVQLERIKSDITYKISLTSPITSKLKLDIETNFVFVETATNNILLSGDKKISIILARNHISIKVKNNIPNIEKYFTFLIIFLNRVFNVSQVSKDFTKIETIYWSRICQNTKTKNRKPVVVGSLDGDMDRVAENFYEGGGREVFVNDHDVMFSCIDPHQRYMHLGFLNIFYKLSGLCIPCCFLEAQKHSETFRACVFKTLPLETCVSPYILNFGKILTPTKISFLPILYNNYFNKENAICFEVDNKRLRSTEGYYVVKALDDSVIHRLKTESNIISFVDASCSVMIVNDLVYYPSDVDKINNRIHILIQEIVHEVVLVRKQLRSDRIAFLEPAENKLLRFYPYITDEVTIFEGEGLRLTTKNFYVDGEPFTEPLSTKYTVYIVNVNPLNTQVYKYFSRFFKFVVTNNLEIFIKTWVINILLRLGAPPTVGRSTLEKYYKLNY
ncbi:early transcription factor large subunit [Nile crocodilepox virus]|uniref:Early transcription factor 82 kDa subunit n=1 Tax=Nile crocodilepox virus (isolate Crocodylus niloticus/Zimbabwe/Ume/2001) TaxID=1289473 RepID=Q070C3_CPRVZ|nr:early transcription factor large subunit [Nile crocodilepox virus]ABJ09019.1 early transcription factor large subunit [Nile crocodilepox virus]